MTVTADTGTNQGATDLKDGRVVAIAGPVVDVEFPPDGLPEINNDHVLDPDGEHIYLSAADRHIYRGSLAGGPVERVSPDDGHWHFLHGVSPDGGRLAYVQITDFSRPGRLAVIERGRARAG